jgi:hypothetical protein
MAVWAGIAAALVAVVAGVAAVVRWGRRLARNVEDFIDDWRGTPSRPGVPERAGVMERLATIERRTEVVAHEVRPNGGASLRDAIDRVDRRTEQIAPTQE